MSRTFREVYFIAAKGDCEDFQQHCTNYMDRSRRGFRSWNNYLFYQQRIWVVIYRSTRWVCTCSVGIKWGHCKHMLGMAIVRGEEDCPEEVKIVSIGKKHKWGRPNKVAGPLVRETGH